VSTVRTISRRVLLGAGIVFLLISLFAGYAQVAVISNSSFADHAAATLDHQDVRSALSQLIVTKLFASAPPRFQSAEPFVEQATGAVLGSTFFKNLFRRSLQRTHTVILSESNNRIVLNLSGQAAVILGVLSRLDPQLASKLQPAVNRLKDVSQSDALLPLIRAVNGARIIEILAPIAGVLCFLLAIALAVNRRHELQNVGIAIAASAAVVWLLLVLVQFTGPWFLSGLFAQAFPGLADVYLSDLRRWCLVLTTAGLALVAIAHASGRPLDLRALGHRLRAWVTGESPGKFAVLGIAAAAIGLILVFEPLAIFRLLLLVAGALAVYFGVYEALRLIGPSSARVSAQTGTIAEGAVGAGRWGAVAVVAVAVTILWVRNIWTV
jgi:hypothetical protein